jgi:transposase
VGHHTEAFVGIDTSKSCNATAIADGGRGGEVRARRILVEAAWSYRYPPRVNRDKESKVEAAPRRVREIAWKAQTRLCGRFRSLERKGKRRTVIATAIARELSAFIWAINRELMAPRQA